MTTLYRLLLRVYPASFRMEYGEEMLAVFAEELRRAGGPAGRLWLLLRAVADVLPNAVASHWEILRQDLHSTVRSLGHARSFALTVVLITAIGVGANTAAFSVTDFVLLRPLPYPEADRLVTLSERPLDNSGWNQLSPADHRDWQRMNTTFQSISAYAGGSANLVGVGDPRRLSVASVSPDLLPMVGVPPFLGRLPTESPADERTAVLSYGLWQSQFGGDPGVLGRSVTLNDAPHQIVGVMPPGFYFPSRDTEAWLPLVVAPPNFEDRDNTYLNGIGRLKDGVTLERARTDLDLVAARLAAQYPETNAETGARLMRLRDELSERSRLLLLALCGASLCILLLACANLAGLLLARAAARERELAVRAALGAGRDRLVRQMVTESAVLALLGGLAGVLLAAVAVPLLARLVPTSLPIAGQPTLDLRVLGFAAAFTGLTGIGFGLVPAFRVGGRTGFSALRDNARAGGGRRQRLRAVLVTVEVALSVVLLVSSGLLVRAVWKIEATDPGFRTERGLTLRTHLPRPRYANPLLRDQFYQRVLDGVRAVPGVESAAFTSFLPMGMTGGIWPVQIPGVQVPPEQREFASLRFVTPGFFATMGMPLLRGRDLEPGDAFDRPFVAVVSESFARRYWPGEDPLGRQFNFAFFDRTVVGLVPDIRVRGLESESEPQVYLSPLQVPEGGLIFYDPKDLVIRSSVAPGALLPAVRQVIRAADSEQPISNVMTLSDLVAGQTASRRAQLRVLVALAGVALVLAGVGIHGLLAFTVAQRHQEIGVRLALGAESGGMARMVLREGLTLALLGIVPGILAAYAAARLMNALLFGIAPGDPVTIGGAAGLALLMTLVGSLLPALRALRVSPLTVMRSE